MTHTAVMRYRKAEIEGLVRTASSQGRGRAHDWMLVVNPGSAKSRASVLLQVEIMLGTDTHITTIPLSGMVAPRFEAKVRHLDNNRQGRDTTPGAAHHVATVRCSTLSSLCTWYAGDIEPLLGYLRNCGVSVID